MLVTEFSADADTTPVTPPVDSHLAWKSIITPAEPFLQAVADRLKEQINAFERDIAVYAEYALSNSVR